MSLPREISPSGSIVVLRHQVTDHYQNATGRMDHYDLLIDIDSNLPLWTWALDENIFAAAIGCLESNHQIDSTLTCDAVKLPDHRRMYLEFEGQLSGERGTVFRVLSGHFETQTVTNSPPWRFRLQLTDRDGRPVTGTLVLNRDSSDFEKISSSENGTLPGISTPLKERWLATFVANSSG